jgi:hypothetical protein
MEEEISNAGDLPTSRLRRDCVMFGIRAQKGSLLSVVEKKRIHHAMEKNGQENIRSTRGEGNAEKRR